MLKKILYIPVALSAVLMFSCSHAVEVKPVEVKPIHITIDVNVKIDKALDDFFEDIDEAEDNAAGTSDIQK